MEIFKYILPAFIVMMTAYLLFDKMLSSEERKRKHELIRKNRDHIVPARLRAYERLLLLLERTDPKSMVIKVIKSEMSCMDLHSQLLQFVRMEFEHNVTQQIYISDDLWRAIQQTREHLIKLINTTAAHVKPDENANKLAEKIIRIYAEETDNPTQITINLLKTEIRNQFF